MNSVLMRNLSSMKEHRLDLYRRCEGILLDKETGELKEAWQSDCVFISRSVNDEPIIGVVKDEREFYLNSKYDAKTAADVWLMQLKEVNYKAIIVVNGIANGMHLKALKDFSGKENRIIVYEPDADIFLTLLFNIDISELLEDERIAIFVEDLNLDNFRYAFKMIYSYELINLVNVVGVPGYSRIYGDRINNFIENYCRNEMKIAFFEKHTIEEYGAEMADNILANMWELCKGVSIDNFKSHMEGVGVDLNKLPAIIVSAGPSLDKNIDDLVMAKGKAFIMCVDSAVPKLLKHNLVPDVIVTVDSHKPLTLFRDEKVSRIPVIACGQSRHEMLQAHRAKVIAFSGDTFLYKFLLSLGKNVEGMQTGGSVANNAFSIAEYIGFKNIILVGQDLAFTDNRKHASDLYEEKEIGAEGDAEYAYVEGQDGSQLLTFLNFKLYKEWFESRIVDNKQLNVINATQGGAKIYGAKHIPLKEALEEFCEVEFDSSLIDTVPYIFEEEQLEELFDCIVDLKNKCGRFIEQFEDGKEKYSRMEELLKAGQTNSLEFKNLVAQLDKIGKLDEKEPIVDLLSMYSKKEEAEILSGMYEGDDGLDGALLVVRQGKDILSVYQKYLAHIENRLKNLIECEISKDIYEISEYKISFID